MCQQQQAKQQHNQQQQQQQQVQTTKNMCSRKYIFNHSGSKQLLLLIISLTSLWIPLSHARHLHDKVALDFAYDEDTSSSSSGFSSSSSSSASSSSGDQLPQWHINPFHGLSESFPSEGSYDNSDMSLSDSSYEEIAQAAFRAARREFRRQRTRHARSNSLRWFTKNVETPEWENPCGGVYSMDGYQNSEIDSSGQHGRVIKKKYLVALRNNTIREYQFVRSNAKVEYSPYQHRQHEYEFLPNMTRPTNQIKLKRWYRNMQTFVGGFAYLGRAEYKYRKQHQRNLGPITFELHELLISARNMLCELETTINSSYPNSNGAKLTRISREAMMDKLKFLTKPDGSQEANERDLRMTKDLYMQYLDNMWKSLHKALRKQQLKNSTERRHHNANGGGAIGTSSGSSSSLINVNSDSAESVGGGSNFSGSVES